MVKEILILLNVVGFAGICFCVGRLTEITKQREFLLKQLDDQVSEFKKQVAKLSTLSDVAEVGKKVAEQVQEAIADELGDAEYRGDNQ